MRGPRAIYPHHLSCCLILHNMGVSDRVMDDVRTRYDPGSVVVGEVEAEEDDEEEESMVAMAGNSESSTPPVSPSTHTLILLPVATTTIRAFMFFLLELLPREKR